MDAEILTEVPQSMKRLIRLIARGFYSTEHALVIDMLVRNPCMKEDDMLELLKFDRKQLRAVINTLKCEKFIQGRMRVDTDTEGKTTRHNYYFINYIMFVNVVKYKLDHVRRKIEMEERDNTSRASFRCDDCQKSYTDLEVDQLFDLTTQTFRCTICDNEVVEDESAIQKKDARTLLAKFNEQIQPLIELLQECEDVRLAPELLEPEPTDIRSLNRPKNTKSNQDKDKWSGDATKYSSSFNKVDIEIDVSVYDEKKTSDKDKPKEQPIWMSQSTVEGIPMETNNEISTKNISDSDNIQTNKPYISNEIETLLMIHEKKSNQSIPSIPAGPQTEDSDSSDSEVESSMSFIQQPSQVDDIMESDGEEEVVMVTVSGNKIPLSDVSDEMVSRMTLEEKSKYIQLCREIHQHMYE
ncbi:General transcription factor IIE subunit 1 [Mactra antiquata]